MPSQYDVQMAWSPDSRELAFTTGGSAHGGKLWLVSLGSTPRKIASSNELAWPSWSPDGRLLTVFDGGALDAFTASGRRAWSVTSGAGPIGWSARGLLATGIYDGATHVVDERGKQRFVAPADTVAWSANGGMLATLKGRRLEVRATGGAIVLQTTLPKGTFGMEWVAPNAVAFEDANGVGHRVGVPSGRITRFDLGALGLNTVRTGTAFAVRDGTRVYTRVPGCYDDGGPVAGIASLQHVPHTRSLVYQSYCPEAFDNLYEVNAGRDRIAPHHDRAEATSRAGALAGRHGHRVLAVGLQRAQLQGMRAVAARDEGGRIGRRGAYEPARLHVRQLGELVAGRDPDPLRPLRLRHRSRCDGGRRRRRNARRPPPPCVDGRVGAGAIGLRERDHRPVVVVDVASRRHRPARVAGIGAGLTSPAWSTDGRLAYLLGTTAVVQGKRVPLPFAQVRSLAWSPDGTRFVVVAKTKGTASFDVYTLRTDGTDLRRITRNVDASSADWR